MRMAFSTLLTKIFPSPIFPVLAAFMMASTAVGHQIVGHHQLDFYLGQKVHDVFAAPINFRVPFLTAESLRLNDRHPLNSERGQRVFHFFKLEWFDNRFDFFHAFSPC